MVPSDSGKEGANEPMGGGKGRGDATNPLCESEGMCGVCRGTSEVGGSSSARSSTEGGVLGNMARFWEKLQRRDREVYARVEEEETQVGKGMFFGSSQLRELVDKSSKELAATALAEKWEIKMWRGGGGD